MLHFPSMQAPLSVDLDPPGRGPLDTCSLGQVGPASALARYQSAVPFPGASGKLPRIRRNLVSYSRARAARQGAPDTLAISIFSPGPMVEDTDTRLM